MTGHERFMKALLRRGEPDRVPVWELIVNEPTLSAFGAQSHADFVEQEDLDGITIFEDARTVPLDEQERQELVQRGCTVPREARQLVRDEWGTVWGVTDFGVPYPIDGPIRERADLRAYTPPDPNASHRLESLREAVRRFKGRKAIVFLTHDGFEFPAYVRGGMQYLLMDYVDDPALCHSLAEMTVEYKIRLMLRAIEEGADVIVSGDDYATRHGPVMSPWHFREFVLPYLERSIVAAHDAGVPYIKHTDGNIWSILASLVDAGIDGIDPLEVSAGMDIGQVKDRYGDRIAVLGNVDCSFVLPRGSSGQVVDAVKETIAKAAPGGGHVLASSNSIHPAVRPENYKTMIETATAVGNYPIDEDLITDYGRRDYIAGYLGADGDTGRPEGTALA